mgnify:CR=1 FL=1
MKHIKLSARSKRLCGAVGMALFTIFNIVLFNDTLNRWRYGMTVLMGLSMLLFWGTVVASVCLIWHLVTIDDKEED